MNVKIVRIPAPSGFTQVPNAALRDERLSYKARGIHANLLSNADDGWTETADTLAEKSPDGRHAIRTGLQELAKYGYIAYRKAQGPDGKWSTEMIVYSVPESGNPTPVPPAETPKKPQVAPKSGNPTSDRGQETGLRHDQQECEFPQVAPESGFPAFGKPDAIQKTTTEDQQKISQSASVREAHRWLHSRYRLTDSESGLVVEEVRRRAATPIKKLVPYLDRMAEGDLADIVAAVMDATQAEQQPKPPPPVQPPLLHAVPDPPTVHDRSDPNQAFLDAKAHIARRRGAS